MNSWVSDVAASSESLKKPVLIRIIHASHLYHHAQRQIMLHTGKWKIIILLLILTFCAINKDRKVCWLSGTEAIPELQEHKLVKHWALKTQNTEERASTRGPVVAQ